MTSVFYAIGDLFTYLFSFMPSLDNLPNMIISVVGVFGFLFWLGELRKHQKAGER